MSEFYGYTGKILKIDLTTSEISTLNTMDYVDDWFGGRGIGAKLHWDLVGPNVKAFDPENVLTFMLGAGTGIIDTRTIVQGVSPLGYPVESYYRTTMGSFFGAELKLAGWDGLVLTGAADHLVYILIENDSVQIKDAGEFRLMDTYSTQERIWSKYDSNYRCALIGPAGENLCRDAIIQSGDHNACGLGGMGAVMGSKKVKLIAVRGTLGSPSIKDPEAVKMYRRIEADAMVPNPGVGAAAGSELELAGKNGEARIGIAACFGCQQPCGYSIKFNDGWATPMGSIKCGEFICCSAEIMQTGEYVGRNHFKRIAQQGLLGLTGQPSYRFVIQNDILNYYDEPITLLHNGIITEADMGIPYTYGTPEFTNMFNTMIAYREGFGDKIADGEAILCNEHLKDVPGAIRDYELNCGRKGIHGFIPGFFIHIYRCAGLLSRVTTTVNAGDQRGLYHYLFPMYEVFKDNATEVGRSLAAWEWTYAPTAVKFMQDFKIQMDIASRCFFNLGADSMGMYMHLNQKIHAAITGIPFDDPEVEAWYCERIWLLERSIQARQGHTREDDDLFDSCYEEYAQFGVTRDGLQAALDEYYDMRGIDKATGLPKKSEYARLGLMDVANELETTYGIVLPE